MKNIDKSKRATPRLLATLSLATLMIIFGACKGNVKRIIESTKADNPKEIVVVLDEGLSGDDDRVAKPYSHADSIAHKDCEHPLEYFGNNYKNDDY